MAVHGLDKLLVDFMVEDLQEKAYTRVAVIILGIIMIIVVSVVVLDLITGGQIGIVRFLVCGLMTKLPLGATAGGFTCPKISI